MTIELKIAQLDTSNASDGNILSYVAANGVVEYRDVVGEIDARIVANVNTVQDNVSALDNNAWVNANDHATYTTVTANIYNTYTALTSYVDGEVANLVASAPATLDTLNELAAALGNDANLSVTLTNAIGTVSANADTNTTSINLVQSNLSALPDSAANDYNTYTTVTGLIDTVQGNVSALDNNAWVNANDYNTYTTLSGLIDTVQDNVASSSSNTQIYVADTLVSNTSVLFEAGNGVAISANATSKTISFAVNMGNVTSQVIALDGSANSFIINQAAANSNMLLVFYNGLAQDPTEYSVSGTTLTLNNVDPIISSSKLEIRHFDFFDVPGISSGGGGSESSFPGTVSGYTSGGNIGSITNIIDKFPFSADTNATDVGDLAQGREGGAGQSSTISGYTSGGNAPPITNSINKFPFAADTNATDVGDLTQIRRLAAGQSSTESGYTSGGNPGPFNTIDKFPFSADANATDVGDLTQARQISAGQSSAESGYTSGGYTPPAQYVNTIDKFSFSSDSNATDVGDLTQGRDGGVGQSSTSSGYTSGGRIPATVDIIDKFPFATNANATDVGDLTQARQISSGQSSTTSGYTSGGFASPAVVPTNVDTIDKFPFSADANATDVGDLTQARYRSAGQQV